MALALEIVVSAALVILAGVALAYFGDAIGDRVGIGRLWIGSVLLAGATSLPELVTDVAAVRLGAIDLAVGDLFGSSMANMAILALLDLHPRMQVLRRAALDHALAAGLAIMLNAAAAIFIIARLPWSWFGIGVGSVLLFAVYLSGARQVFLRSALIPPPPEDGERGKSTLTWPRASLGFLAAAALILVAAPRFAHAAETVAQVTGLGRSFVGTTLMGLSTSLPELATSIAAIRMRAFDLAVANLFGSNALNMAVFLGLDLASSSGPVLNNASASHVVSGLVATVMMSTGIAAIVLRTRKTLVFAEPGGLMMLLTYFGGLWLLRHVTVTAASQGP